MRLRLLRRRLTVSAPRVSVRSAAPWPVRWLLAALVLGFSGALALWAFEFGKEIAGLDRNAKQELAQLRTEVRTQRSELERLQAVADTAEALLTAERVAQEQLSLQLRQLEADNQTLRSDLGFFERLLPAPGADLAIRGIQVERVAPGQIRWQTLMMQATRNAPDFRGTLEITFNGMLNGKPWSMPHAARPQPVVIKGYLRQEGVLDVPPEAVVKSVTARLLHNGVVRTMQTVSL
ncbi:MAG TPA: hypothetical protein PKC60_10555 [Hydrogenophaga sp.]|uniref:DUF6776 family protein n=1 Tax=Hydrogenophaga sp. TaxID=1904254 RepID=UPI002BDD56BF|nr:DUF6776 family protein [Hydrogenophaga sp.]HMN93659.1 hypothetical protein [Hydrogenophaga sp.]HMP10970.1 hypothetical protein [Hydrogenophaga sp.]